MEKVRYTRPGGYEQWRILETVKHVRIGLSLSGELVTRSLDRTGEGAVGTYSPRVNQETMIQTAAPDIIHSLECVIIHFECRRTEMHSTEEVWVDAHRC